MNRPPNHYQTLGIPQEATPQVLRAAYRRLARTYHPDRYEGRGDSGATMARINQAYEVLSDPQARARYDASIAPPPRTQPAAVSEDAGPVVQAYRPWLLLWAVFSVTVLVLGWVTLRIMVPERDHVPSPATVQRAPAERAPPAPLPPIEAWKLPAATARAGTPESEPVKRLIREGVLHRTP